MGLVALRSDDIQDEGRLRDRGGRMSDKDENRGVVRLDTGEVAATRPQFIVAVDGKYYLTLAVWEFDPDQHHLTPDQREGVAEIGDIFARLRREGWDRGAVEIPPRRSHEKSFSPQHTFP